MKRIIKIVSFCLAVGMTFSAMTSSAVYAETTDFITNSAYSEEMRGLSAIQLVSDMGAGWNLGNSFESETEETYWGNPVTTKKMIDSIAAEGFKTIRIPVRWDDHYSDKNTYTIDTAFLNRVSEVVDYALDNGMYVILNSHHCDYQTQVSSTPSEAVKKELATQWTQIAGYFKNYGDKLIFETNNEPRRDEDWKGTSAYYECVNVYNEAARAAIRATGGNNTRRLISMPTYCASGDEPKIAAWKKPADDDMISVSIHAYLPYDFAFTKDGHSNWIASDEAELNAFFNRLKTYFIDKGIPVIVDEFGSVDKSNTNARITCAKYYTSLARRFAEQDIPCVWWDNNCVGTDGENFGIFNRQNDSWYYKSIADAIVNAYEGDPEAEVSCSSETILFEGKNSSIKYGQAVTLPASAVTTLSEGDSIYAVFSGQTPEIILQSWTNGDIWCKVNPDSISNGTAVWSYSTLYNAYKKDGGTPFLNLDVVYVGDTGGYMEVTKVYSSSSSTSSHTHSYDGAEKISLEASPTTKGRKTVSCSVPGCTAYKVVTFDYQGGSTAEVSEIEAFVDRLYTIILDRSAEAAGLADWTNDLKNGKATSADIVYGLANSDEFKNKALSNDEIIERMYLAMLGRSSDAAGKADWLNTMANGVSVNGIINGFSGSEEFANICSGYGIKAGNITTCEPRDKNVNLTSFVSRMYTKALNRAYDVNGLNDWTGDYLAGKATADKIAYGFILSQEFEGRNLTDEQYVDTLYRTFFDREPDEGGKSGWLDELAKGTSRKDVLDGFLGAQEFANLKGSFGV